MGFVARSRRGKACAGSAGSRGFGGDSVRGALEQARDLADTPAAQFQAAWLERLNDWEAQWVTGIGTAAEGPAHSAEDCARTLKRLRFDREREALQREIARLQDEADDDAQARIAELSIRKIELKRRIEALSAD